MCWFLLPGALVFIDNFLYSWVNEHTVNTRGLQEQRTAHRVHPFLPSAHPQGLRDFEGPSPVLSDSLPPPPHICSCSGGSAWQPPHLHRHEIRPLPRAPHTHLQLWFIISLTISVLYFSALFGLWLLFGSLSYWTFIPFQETLFFFSSLSQLINNRESTSLEEAHPAS